MLQYRPAKASQWPAGTACDGRALRCIQTTWIACQHAGMKVPAKAEGCRHLEAADRS